MNDVLKKIIELRVAIMKVSIENNPVVSIELKPEAFKYLYNTFVQMNNNPFEKPDRYESSPPLDPCDLRFFGINVKEQNKC